ncbi:MAG: class I SAM-dependent methyltransferase [Firmicutes bacterium]|nr:class I SAM-dependent methyltransferase [Bacillota bacterium]
MCEPNTGKFTGKAAIYAKYRPSYPREFIDYLYTEAGFNGDSTIADVGAGTGILSRQLAARGSRVILIEPNGDMLRTARKELAEFRNCEFLHSAAENIALPDDSVDFVTVAQAFHWFDRERFKAECRRLLRPGGKVMLVWNDTHNGGADEMNAEIARVNEKYCRDFAGFSGGTAQKSEMYEDFFEGGCVFRRFAGSRTLDEETFVGGSLSGSYAPKEGADGYTEYVGALRDVFRRFSINGTVTNPVVTRSYCGKV